MKKGDMTKIGLILVLVALFSVLTTAYFIGKESRSNFICRRCGGSDYWQMTYSAQPWRSTGQVCANCGQRQ